MLRQDRACAIGAGGGRAGGGGGMGGASHPPCHLATVPQGVVGDRLPWVGNDKGGGGVRKQSKRPVSTNGGLGSCKSRKHPLGARWERVQALQVLG